MYVCGYSHYYQGDYKFTICTCTCTCNVYIQNYYILIATRYIILFNMDKQINKKPDTQLSVIRIMTGSLSPYGSISHNLFSKWLLAVGCQEIPVIDMCQLS